MPPPAGCGSARRGMTKAAGAGTVAGMVIPVRGRLRGPVVDAVLAVALTALWEVELWAPDALPAVAPVARHQAALTVAGAVMLLPLAARRTAPLESCGAVMAGAI